MIRACARARTLCFRVFTLVTLSKLYLRTQRLTVYEPTHDSERREAMSAYASKLSRANMHRVFPCLDNTRPATRLHVNFDPADLCVIAARVDCNCFCREGPVHRRVRGVSSLPGPRPRSSLRLPGRRGLHWHFGRLLSLELPPRNAPALRPLGQMQPPLPRSGSGRMPNWQPVN